MIFIILIFFRFRFVSEPQGGLRENVLPCSTYLNFSFEKLFKFMIRPSEDHTQLTGTQDAREKQASKCLRTGMNFKLDFSAQRRRKKLIKHEN